MFKLDSEEAVLKTFRPKDRGLVEFQAGQRFPVILRDCWTWTHPAGGRVFLVFASRGGVPTGIVFDSNGGDSAGVPQMCDWCRSPGMGTQIGLLTAKLSGKKRVGVHLCSDLSCKQKLEDEADRNGAPVAPAIDALLERMGRFASEGLGIDLTGANR